MATAPTDPPPGPRASAALLAAALATGALLRSAALGRESYWLDELSSIVIARRPWPALLDRLATADYHPPLYFALLKLWCARFGYGEAAVRAPSVLADLAAVAFGYLLAGRLAGRRAALCAAALLACSPFCVQHAREARGYSLLLALSLAATWLLVRAAPSFRARSLAPYALVAAALPYTHVFGVFTLAAHAGYAAAVAGRRDQGLRPLLRSFGAMALAAAAFLPWLPATLAQAARARAGFWLTRDTMLWLTFSWWEEGPLAVWTLVTLAAAAVAVARAGRGSRAVAALLALGVALPTAVPFAWSLAARPVFQPKYGIAAAGLALVAAALSFARLPRGVVLLTCALGVAASVATVHLRTDHDQWRELAAFASRESARAVPLVCVRSAEHLGVYLGPRSPCREVGRHELTTAGPDALTASRFWLLLPCPPHLDAELEPLFEARWRRAEAHRWKGVAAELWVDRGAARTIAP